MSEHTTLTEAERAILSEAFGGSRPSELLTSRVERILVGRDATTRNVLLRDLVVELADQWEAFPCGGTEALRQLRAVLAASPAPVVSRQVLMTEPHDGHAADETCPGCPHDAPVVSRPETTVKAEALREAADWFDSPTSPLHMMGAADGLRHLAAHPSLAADPEAGA